MKLSYLSQVSNNKARYTGYAIVLAGALLMFSPFYFMFVFATHTSSEIFSMPPPFWFGSAFLDNMASLMRHIPFWRNLGWSVYVALASTALTLLFCSMGGYAFAMFEFRFKAPLFALVEEARTQGTVSGRYAAIGREIPSSRGRSSAKPVHASGARSAHRARALDHRHICGRGRHQVNRANINFLSRGPRHELPPLHGVPIGVKDQMNDIMARYKAAKVA